MIYPTDTYIGIDPGTTGAIAFLYKDGSFKFFNLPTTSNKTTKGYQKNSYDLEQILDLLETNSIGKAVITIEHVSSMPTQGISSTGVMMRCFGQLEGIAYAFAGGYNLVRPARWKKHFNITADKQESKKLLSSKYKLGRCNHNQTDALCIALYAMEIETDASTISKETIQN